MEAASQNIEHNSNFSSSAEERFVCSTYFLGEKKKKKKKNKDIHHNGKNPAPLSYISWTECSVQESWSIDKIKWFTFFQQYVIRLQAEVSFFFDLCISLLFYYGFTLDRKLSMSLSLLEMNARFNID